MRILSHVHQKRDEERSASLSDEVAHSPQYDAESAPGA